MRHSMDLLSGKTTIIVTVLLKIRKLGVVSHACDLTLRRLRQKDCNLEASLGYKVRICLRLIN
jgi:hypothetical protein